MSFEMHRVNQSVFPKSEIDEYYKSLSHQLSDFFPTSKILSDGKFSSTQLTDINIPNSICFCESPRYIESINTNNSITCTITLKNFSNKFTKDLGIILSEDPKTDFFRLHNSVAENFADRSVFKSSIKGSAKIHSSAVVEPNCFIGDNVVISPGAIVLNNSYIEDDVFIGPNVVIGAEGLEFKRQPDGKLLKIKHIGGVYLSKAVEVMANSVIAKDVFFGYTTIGSGCKIGPLCNIAHRVHIGSNCCIAGNSTLGGSTKIGQGVWIGPSVTVSSGIKVGDQAKLSLGSVIVKNVKPHQTVSGFFAVEHSKALKLNAVIRSKGI